MIKLLIIFGGISKEHEISCISAGNILEQIKKDNYKITMVGIDKCENWLEYTGEIFKIKNNIWLSDKNNLKMIQDKANYISKYDVVFPILHGKFGEDGKIQAIFEKIGIDYVGCDSKTSAICIDKVLSKKNVGLAGVPVVPYQTLSKEEKLDLKLEFPLIVKPNTEGSSYGVMKANNKLELKIAIENAFEFDNSILIEQFINAREIECAVLGNDFYVISDIGEIIPDKEFYDFESKYVSNGSVINIGEETKVSLNQRKTIRDYTETISKLLGVKGLARIDFFISKDDEKIYFNEINTMPGFTDISMYPKLMENEGINYSDLIDELIKLSRK